MTDKKQLKARIRARMAKTGESYTTARRHVLGATAVPEDGGWQLKGGHHPGTAVVARLTGIPEPLVFLAGGGIGAGYILWEFKEHNSASLVLAFSNQWQYYDRWMAKTLDRLAVPYTHHTTGGAKGAARRLAAELDAGRPCVVLPDRYHIGYWRLPKELDGYGGHPVIAYRREGGFVHVDDRGSAPIRVPEDRMEAARGRVSSYKNSLYVLGERGEADLAEVAREGLRDCAEHLSAPSDSFSLPAWRKWGRLLTDERNAKGWPRVFADGTRLAGALLSIWECAEAVGIDGGNLRDLFADGLDAAAPLLGRPELGDLAAEYRRICGMWHEMAETALPYQEFGRIRELTAAVREAVLADGEARREDAEELWRLRAEADRARRKVDFAAIAERVLAIHAAESAAIARLREIV
ncbi:BtrH N-terminal domain-containing protein [Nonomuraea typhae]|uniref:BtrH N-terminal domain-containing protein n=1 Tax=Nonomuraea typhae TaxID=2603600 RepID=UPI0012FA68EA|nr:BtrH N-terminal domain-containing protein [Nonomuraea typhae]